jgi:uncharacterized protein with PCYCGC motif
MTDVATATTGPHGEEEPGLPEEPAPRRWIRTAATLVVVMALAAGVTYLGVGRDGGHAGPAPLDLATVSADIAGHYRNALAHADSYREIPCWCGCQQFLGHRNLFDCFVRPDGRGWEAHAAGCGVCNGEAAMAQRMLDEGQAPNDVATAVNLEFGVTAITRPHS